MFQCFYTTNLDVTDIPNHMTINSFHWMSPLQLRNFPLRRNANASINHIWNYTHPHYSPKSFVQQTCIEEAASTGVLSSLSLTNLGNRNEMPCNQRFRKFSSQTTFFDKQWIEQNYLIEKQWFVVSLFITPFLFLFHWSNLLPFLNKKMMNNNMGLCTRIQRGKATYENNGLGLLNWQISN